MDDTSIRISVETRKRIEEQKVHPRQSADEALNNVLNSVAALKSEVAQLKAQLLNNTERKGDSIIPSPISGWNVRSDFPFLEVSAWA